MKLYEQYLIELGVVGKGSLVAGAGLTLAGLGYRANQRAQFGNNLKQCLIKCQNTHGIEDYNNHPEYYKGKTLSQVKLDLVNCKKKCISKFKR